MTARGESMTGREVAMRYIECFCRADINGLQSLLADGLKFTGTLHSFYSAADYIDSLRRDPPEICGFDIRSITEDSDSVVVFYDYRKPDRVIRMAQLFRVTGCRISEIMLVFDSRDIE